MSRRERVLLWVLGALVLAAGTWIGAARAGAHVATLQEQIASYHTQLRALSAERRREVVTQEEIGALRSRVQALEARLSGEEIPDPYVFGERARELLTAHGLVLEEIQSVTLDGPVVVQFSGRGPARSVLSAVDRVFSGERSWSMPFLSLQQSGRRGELRFVMRLGYEE